MARNRLSCSFQGYKRLRVCLIWLKIRPIQKLEYMGEISSVESFYEVLVFIYCVRPITISITITIQHRVSIAILKLFLQYFFGRLLPFSMC